MVAVPRLVLLRVTWMLVLKPSPIGIQPVRYCPPPFDSRSRLEGSIVNEDAVPSRVAVILTSAPPSLLGKMHLMPFKFPEPEVVATRSTVLLALKIWA